LESTLLHITPRDSGPIYYGYYLVGAAFVAQFISTGMYSYVLGSFMAPMTDELGWSRADFTLTRTIGQMVMAVVGIYIGSRVDVYGGRPIMLVGQPDTRGDPSAHQSNRFALGVAAAKWRTGDDWLRHAR
jgi:hypothetical protein